MKFRLFLLVILFLFSYCHPIGKIKSNQLTVSGPPTLVYKTKKDYYQNVPVLLSADRKNIVSYPDPKDLNVGDKFSLPTKLEDGYLLDNRGIRLDVGFLNISYMEYSKLGAPPSKKELEKLLIDTDPLTELYDLGSRYKFNDIEKEINKIIRRNKLTAFRKLK